MSCWIKLTKNNGTPVWINASLMVRIDSRGDGAHLDFQDADLEEVVDQKPDEIVEIIAKHHNNRAFRIGE